LVLNEFVVWDEVIDPSNITLVDPNTGVTSAGQSLNGSSRTGWVDVAALDGSVWESLAASEIRSGTTQIQAGLTQTGSLAGSTDPGVANVRSGTGYTIEGSSLTGALDVPAAASGTAGTVDLNNILEQIQYALEQANTTTGLPIDLSANLTNRVRAIHKINPASIEPDLSQYPAVTVWIERKDVEFMDISVNQTKGRRKATIDVKVAGIVYLDNYGTRDEHKASLERNILMENIERVLRGYDTFSSSVDKQRLTDSLLFDVPYSDQTNLKAGVLSFDAVKIY
jgi:hypothetical protein